jgi:monoamine oxidase
VQFKSGIVLLQLDGDVIPAWGVVVTVPMGVLQAGAIAFDPDLPSPVKKAVGCLKMGSYKKIVLVLQETSALVNALEMVVTTEIKKPPPQGGVRDLSIFGLDPDGKPWKFLYRIKEKIVVCFVGGSLALTLDSLDNNGKLCELSLRALGYVLGLADPPPATSVTEILTSRWSADEFSCGAYTYTIPGGVGSRKLLQGAVVHERMVFAGEALWYEEYGTAHGAYLTGEMAARQLQVLPLTGGR